MSDKIDSIIKEIFLLQEKRADLMVLPKSERAKLAKVKHIGGYKNDLIKKKNVLILELRALLKNETPEAAQKVKDRLSSKLGIYLP